MGESNGKVGEAASSTLWLRGLLLIIPTLTVLVVALSWFVLGRERPVLAARVYLGPVPQSAMGSELRVAFRVHVQRSFHGVETPQSVPVRVEISGPGLAGLHQELISDAQGVSVVNLVSSVHPGQPAIGNSTQIRVTSGTTVLAEGFWGEHSFPEQRRAGTGFLQDPLKDGMHLSLSLTDGVLAVPFENRLRVRFTRDGAPLPNIPVKLEFDGATVTSKAAPITDSQGQAEASIRTTAHQVSVRLEFQTESGLTTVRQFDLPVVAGAIHASLSDDVLTVRAPVPRDVVHVNIVNEQQTLWAATVPLKASEIGAEGQVRLPELAGPVWAITSSELDLQSMALVGWPIGPPSARTTLSRRDHLAIDGFKTARAAEAARQSGMRELALLVALAAALLEIVLLLRYTRVRSVADTGRTPELTLSIHRGSGARILAVLLLVLGFAALIWLIAVRH